jgi:HEAT repeat protein
MAGLILLATLAPPDELEELKARWAASRDAPILNRVQILRSIAALKTDAAVEFLLGELRPSDPSPEIREAVVRALALVGTPRAYDALVQVLGRPQEPRNARRAALESLAPALDSVVSWDRDEARRQIQRLAMDRRPANDLRRDAIELLGRFPPEQTLRDLKEILRESEPDALIPALRALAPAKDPKVLERAREILENPKHSEAVRAAALLPLAAVGDAEQTRRMLQIDFAPDGPLEHALIDALASLEDPEASRLVRSFATGSERPSVRVVCLRALGPADEASALPTFKRALQDQAEPVREAAVEGLSRCRSAEAWALLREVAQGGTGRIALTALGALGRAAAEAERPACAALLTRLAQSTHDAVRVTALLALGELAPDGLLETLALPIEHAHWPTRAAAVRAAGSVRAKQAVDLLIDRLAREDGRLRWDIAQSLLRLTGKTLGVDPAAWRDWWTPRRESFAFADAEGSTAAEDASFTKAYYGVPLLSKRIVFCIDASSSMRASSADKRTTKLDEARRQLKKTLGSLDPDVKFNLVFFADKPSAWESKLQPATAANVNRAMEMAGRARADGHTDLYGALMTALGDPEVDTVFLLSDGDPSAGKITDPRALLREFRAVNRARLVVVHTISLGPNALMKELAERTGGRAVVQ